MTKTKWKMEKGRWKRALGLGIGLFLLTIPGTVVAQKAEEIQILRRDPAGKGLLCKYRKKRILFVEGTPEQMGAAQGTLQDGPVRALMERVVYGVGGAYSVRTGDWFIDRMKEVERRTKPFVPERFIRECDAMSQAAGVPVRDGRYGNFFPEMFHCSGVAVRGKATVDGSVIHARVLDYMRDIGLQRQATVTVFMPDGHNTWISLGYAGFIGTVTAMNAKGVAIGEMGGRGEGSWDGLPMSLMLRDIMERAESVQDAVRILQETPRTCEYYYVISDKAKAMVGTYCTSEQVLVLQPGQQDERLPLVPEDTVLFSGGSRAKHLSERIQAAYGKIDVKTMIEIIKRPVAMRSNLHNAIFKPETQEMWVADAGKRSIACNEPYVRVCIPELVQFYQDNKAAPAE